MIKVTSRKVAIVKQKIAEGFSLRQAAPMAGVSVYTAQRIGKGFYDDVQVLQAPQEPEEELFNEHERENWLI